MLLAAVGTLIGALSLLAGTGIGATSLSTGPDIDVTVLSSLALTDPSALDSTPAATTGVSWTAGSPDVLNLGALQPTDQATAALTWRVTTNNVTGYTVTLQNVGSAPLMRSGSNTLADMPATPAALDATKSHFGVAVGDAVGHAQASVAAAWGNGSTQGTLYRGIPAGSPVQVATRGTAQTNDPFTLNFAVTTAASQPVAAGSYTGTIMLTAQTI